MSWVMSLVSPPINLPRNFTLGRTACSLGRLTLYPAFPRVSSRVFVASTQACLVGAASRMSSTYWTITTLSGSTVSLRSFRTQSLNMVEVDRYPCGIRV